MLDLLIAAVLSLHIHGASIHSGDRTQYNEQNWGLGVRVGDWGADAFVDSYENPAGLVGRVYETEHQGLYWGGTFGYVYHTNYQGLAPIPHVRWEGAHVGVRGLVIPSDTGMVYGFSLIVPIRR